MNCNIESIKNSYASIGINLSDKKAKEIYENINKAAHELTNLISNVWCRVRECIETIIKTYKSLDFRDKQKFIAIKVLKPNKQNFVNGPRLIHCRNNC